MEIIRISPRSAVCRIRHNGSVIIKATADMTEEQHQTQCCIMKFIEDNKIFNIPKILSAEYSDGVSVILQEDIDGDILEDIWNDLDEKARDNIVSNIKDSIRKMKSAKLDDLIKSMNNNLVVGDPRFFSGVESSRFGFNMMKRIFGDDFVICHCDLDKRNVIIRDEDVYVIDWECSGLYPRYFEEHLAKFWTNIYTDIEWRNNIFDYPLEVDDIMKELIKYLFDTFRNRNRKPEDNESLINNKLNMVLKSIQEDGI